MESERARERRNNEKADLEDDISAITLLPDLGEGHEDTDLAALAARKAKGSRSRRTNRTVAESYEENKLSGKLMQAVDVSVGFGSPPQLSDGPRSRWRWAWVVNTRRILDV